ncbi:hypothetical protein ACFPJ4_04220 [Lysinimonas soli]|uniref:Aldehyde dehydrogenase family protein n=1 Tax=Lysinimonas soli TaxID=1074233 RepID=A0ABW0NQ99_9MICO
MFGASPPAAAMPVLASLVAQFAHPPLSRAAAELSAFDDVLPEFASRLARVDSTRLEVTETIPIGTVAVLALPTVATELYVRHVAAALLMGNSIVLSPLNGAQDLVAAAVSRVSAERVRIAGEHGSPRLGAPATVLVTIGPDSLRVDGVRETPHRDDAAERLRLCARYSRVAVDVVTVRSTFVGPPRPVEPLASPARLVTHQAAVAACA